MDVSLRGAFLVLVLLGALSGAAEAQLYRWTDDEGNVHYADSPDRVPERFREGANRVSPDKLEAVPIAPAPPSAMPKAPVVGSRRDVVVSTAGALYAVTTHTRVYEIVGRTAADVRTAMSRQRPGAHDGQTTSAYRWRYRTTSLGSTCVVAYVELEMTVSIDVPGWSAPPDAPAGLAERWDRYLEALRSHEEGHRHIAVNEGYEVLQAVMQVRTVCTHMDDAIQAAARAVSARYREGHVQYDAQTRDGATQGAVFP